MCLERKGEIMIELSITQWLLCFVIYSFLGWIWECCVVSLRAKRFVNRGFMHGPFIPMNWQLIMRF